jgi:putative tryptophan/tyrosine transport system substrate-binding protein
MASCFLYRRREFITLLGGAAAWPLAARAQQPKMLRVGLVSVQPRSAQNNAALERRLAELGYQDGRNLIFDFVQVASFDQWEAAIRDIGARKADIIVASGPEISLKTALAITGVTPIVMIAIDYDPFARGYVTSLARPSGNVTGLFLQQIELTVKRVQLLKDGFPDMKAATVFWDRLSSDQWDAARDAGAKLGLRLAGVELRDPPYDFDRALAEAPADHRKNLLVMTSPFFFRDRARLADLALRNRAASMFSFREWVDEGGLLSYGPSFTGMYRRAAEYVNRIARGAKTTDLPIEQPTKFELIVNRKTARAIGIEVPTALLLLADEVIE